MRNICCALSLAVISASPVFGQPVRIQVFTAAVEGGFIDEDSKRRADSMKDLLKFGESKKKTMVLKADEAKVTLEVVGRDWVPTGDSKIVRDPLSGGVSSRAEQCLTVFTVLTCGDYSTEIVGRSCPFPPYGFASWRGAAGFVISKLEKWVKDNKSQACLQ